ncbi:MAG: YceD family protein [Bacillota bacterium]
MLINIGPIRERKGGSIEEEFTYEPRLKTAAGLEISPFLRIRAILTNTSRRYILGGEVSGLFSTCCDRCLKPFTSEFKFALSEVFSDDVKICAEDDNVVPFSGDEIDLSKSVMDALILNLPMRFLCKESCPGLCPYCGKDLNEGQCGCKNDSANTAFQQWKKLLDPSEEV